MSFKSIFDARFMTVNVVTKYFYRTFSSRYTTQLNFQAIVRDKLIES